MKKLYLSILILICCSQLRAQGYFPMLDSISNNWHYIATVIPLRTASPGPNCDYLTSSFNYSASKMFTSGDTIINSITYKKLDQEQSMIPNSECFFGYLREDTATQRIYFMDNLLSPEVLLYDFSLQVGDSIYYDFVVQQWYYTNGYYTVDSIVNITINAGQRRLFYLRNHSTPFPPQYPMEWIESVGHPGHVVLTHAGNQGFGGGLFSMCNDYLIRDYYQSLSCFEHYTQKVFFDSCAHSIAVNNSCFYYADSCNYFNICGSLEENGLINEFKIIPNPSSEPTRLYIEANRHTDADLEVYDISGKQVMRKEFTLVQGINEEPLASDQLASGSYLIVLRFDTGTVYRKLIRTP